MSGGLADYMGAMLTLIGFMIALFAWINPMGFDTLVRVALFIVGFDMMGAVVKILVFWMNIAFPVFGDEFGSFSWTLLILLFGEMGLVALGADKPYRLAVKPLIVFIAVFMTLGFEPALVLAGIDLLMNLIHKIKRNGKRRPKKDKKGEKRQKQAEVA